MPARNREGRRSRRLGRLGREPEAHTGAQATARRRPRPLLHRLLAARVLRVCPAAAAAAAIAATADHRQQLSVAVGYQDLQGDDY